MHVYSNGWNRCEGREVKIEIVLELCEIEWVEGDGRTLEEY